MRFDLPRRSGLVLFAAILLLAAFLRLYRLDQLPPGLHYDEAFNATQARQVLAGTERPLLFRGDLTEEPLAIYVTAVLFGLLGASPWSLHLVSALAGILTVAAVYALARELLQSRWQAALASFVMAILYWHINFSRLGMEPIFLPLLLTLGLWFLWRGLRSTHAGLGDFILAGLFLGGTLYTYKSGLFVPVLVMAFLALEVLVTPGFWARYGRGVVFLGAVAVLVFAPLGLYFAMHPSEFLERPSAVLVAASGADTLLDNGIRVAGMFVLRGDENPRSNLPFRPALDPFLALGFIAGLVACIARWRKPEARFLLLWLVVMVLPSVVTDFAPHFGRSIGVTPALVLLVAWGFAWLGEMIRVPRSALAVVLVLGLATSTYSTLNDYFGNWGSRTGLFDSFDVGTLSLANLLRARPANEAIYLSPIPADNYTVQFGLAGRDARGFDGRHVLVLPPPGVAAVFGVVTRDDGRSIERLKQIFPRGSVVGAIGDWTGQPYASILRSEEPPQIAPAKTVGARFGETLELIGYDLIHENGALVVRLYWGSIADTPDDYTVFVHLTGKTNPVTNSPVWAQDDARPGHNSYPTSRWQAGEVIIDDYRLVLPDLSGEYEIEVGMYILETGARVHVSNANGASMENDRVLLERISVP